MRADFHADRKNLKKIVIVYLIKKNEPYYSRTALEHRQKHSKSLLGLDLYSAVLMNHFSPLPLHVAPQCLDILYLCVVTVWAKTTDIFEHYSFYLTVDLTNWATKF